MVHKLYILFYLTLNIENYHGHKQFVGVTVGFRNTCLSGTRDSSQTTRLVTDPEAWNAWRCLTTANISDYGQPPHQPSTDKKNYNLFQQFLYMVPVSPHVLTWITHPRYILIILHSSAALDLKTKHFMNF